MKTRRLFLKAFFLVAAVILLATAAYARPRTTVKNIAVREENPKGSKSALVLPYAFSSDSMGVTVGVGGALKGYEQKQLLLGAAAFGSFARAVGLFLGMWDYRPSWARRFFFCAQGMVGHYPNQRAYAAPSYEPGTDRPGSDDSDKDDYSEESGYDNWTDWKVDGGFGLRAMFAGGVVRFDVGISDEGTNVWAMFGQPF